MNHDAHWGAGGGGGGFLVGHILPRIRLPVDQRWGEEEVQVAGQRRESGTFSFKQTNKQTNGWQMQFWALNYQTFQASSTFFGWIRHHQRSCLPDEWVALHHKANLREQHTHTPAWINNRSASVSGNLIHHREAVLLTQSTWWCFIHLFV